MKKLVQYSFAVPACPAQWSGGGCSCSRRRSQPAGAGCYSCGSSRAGRFAPAYHNFLHAAKSFLYSEKDKPCVWFSEYKKDLNHNDLGLFSKSEWGDLNARPLEPHSSTLPTALHPDFFSPINIAQRKQKSN